MQPRLSVIPRRYRGAGFCTLILAGIAAWPAILAPTARVYTDICARYLTDVPFWHHVPPLLVGFIMPVILVVALVVGVALLQQISGQRRLDATLGKRCAPDRDRERVAHRLHASARLVVTVDDAVYAFCSGLIRPHVYLSRGMLRLLSDDEVEAVIRHELRHAQRRDPLRFFVARIMRAFATVFPVLVTVDERLRIRAELAADRAVLDALPVESLASALVKVMRASPSVDYRAIVAGFSPTDARVAALLGRTTTVAFDWRDAAVSAWSAALLGTLMVWLATQSVPMSAVCALCSFG